jgi:hypothetical protein
MRKVTREVTDAFFNRRPRKCGNTRTDGTTIWLHGNAIARHADNGDIEITLAGWDTVTTRERLNGVGRRAGFGVFRVRGVTKVASVIGVPTSDTDMSWQPIDIEMPHGEWINPRKFVGQFADK